MKALFAALACVALACPALRAADDAPARTPLQLEELVAPIALYPDPLVALILPAATRPTEIVLAMRFLDRGGNAELATRESWDDSVKALTRYREVLEYLDRQLDWTRALGEAFFDQPEDVMTAIQRVRARARSAGLLTDTREQLVYADDDEIRIVPASPTVLYVPRYNPTLLFVETRTYPTFWLTFGVSYGVGTWLNYDCDWRYRSVRIIERPPHWYHAPDWRPAPRRTFYTSSRWTPPDRDRRDDRPRPDFNRPRSRPEEYSRDGARPDSRRYGDRSRRPENFPAATTPPAPLNAATVASTAPEGPTAPTIVSTAPNGPTAPSIVSQGPAASAPRRADRPRVPREDREPDRIAPRSARPDLPERTARPDNAAPVQRSPRVDSMPRSEPPRFETPRFESPRPAPAPTPAPARTRDDSPTRKDSRHENGENYEPR